MEREQAQEIVKDAELSRWRSFVMVGEARAKPRVFELSDLRQNPVSVIETIAGPLQIPDTPKAGEPEWCFFADDLPDANWEHPCRYLLVYSDGSIHSISARVPPDVESMGAEVFPFALEPLREPL